MGPTDVDPAAILRQLEYYFSDSNLPRDKFLRAKTEENESGFVDLSVLLSFKRLQTLNATASHLAAAAKTSKLLALSPDETRVRRKTPLPEASLFHTRAVFAKGWPPNSEEPSLDAIRELFSPSGDVLSVRIRRWSDDEGKRHFKGSIFVEMGSPEAAERVVAEEYTVDVPGEDGAIVSKTLTLLPVEEYFQKKKEEDRERAKRRKARYEQMRAKKAEGKDAKESEAKGEGDTLAKEEDATEVKKERDVDGKDQNKDRKEEKDRKITPGLILRFEGFGPEVSREDIKEAFEPHGEVDWVDFQRGDSEGYIRFAREGAAKTAGEAMVNEKIEFGGKVPTFSVLTGEAETTYWKQMWEKKDMKMENMRKRRRENGRGFGGRGGGKRFRGGGGGRGGRGRGGGGFRGRR